MARKNKKKEEEEKLKKAEQEKIEAKKEQVPVKVETVSAPEEQSSTQQVAKKHKSWLTVVFGGFVFLSSTASLFLLYKYRKNFAL